MTYGQEVGRKFYEDGKARRYPGNTVVADITPEYSAYGVMVKLLDMVEAAGFDKSHLIMLPKDSYHMTVIRGLNDQVRKDGFWPEKLSREIPMEEVDDYISAAVGRVEMLGKIRMKFDKVTISTECVKAVLLPADDEQAEILKNFRDKVADEIGLRLPKHDEYVYHITLAYVRVVPEGDDEIRVKDLISKMNEYVASQPVFEITPPYMAYYNDMLAFSPVRLPRK